MPFHRILTEPSTGMRSSRRVEELFCGLGRYALRTRDGCLWIGGPAEHHGDMPTIETSSVLHTAARSIAFGDVNAAIVHMDGRLVMTSTPCASLPQLVKSYESLQEGGFEVPGKYLQCAIGETHVLALDDQHAVWGWGSNNSGQLGFPPEQDVRSLSERLQEALSGDVDVSKAERQATSRRLILENVKRIQAGYETSFALSRDGILFGWGTSSHGHLLGEPWSSRGFSLDDLSVAEHMKLIKHTVISRYKPEVLMYDVSQFSCSRHHGLAIMMDGSLWGWGRNEFGQARGDGLCGTASGLHHIADDVISCAAGARHSAYVDKRGNLFVWGCNDAGQLGIGTTTNEAHAFQVSEGYAQVACGTYCSLALHASGAVHHMGVIDQSHPSYPHQQWLALRPRVIWKP